MGRAMRLVAAASILLLTLPQQVAGQEHVPVDTAAVLSSALSRFPTTNGPVVEVAVALRCGQEQCRSAAAEQVLTAIAEEWSARVVDPDAPLPPCRWNTSPLKPRKGLRVQASTLMMFQGSLAVSVKGSCGGGVGRGTFYESVIWKVERIDGEWMTSDILMVSVT